MTAANAAEEVKGKGEKNITPYWRTLKMGGVLNDKYPGGSKVQKELLEKEGFRILLKRKKYVVENYDKYLVK
jgi:alkylated DNA nucleotide flippase Atl1